MTASLHEVLALLTSLFGLGAGVIYVTGFYVTNRILSHYGVIAYDISRRNALVVGAYSLISAVGVSGISWLTYLAIYVCGNRILGKWSGWLTAAGAIFMMFLMFLSISERWLLAIRRRWGNKPVYVALLLLVFASSLAMTTVINERKEGWFLILLLYHSLLILFIIVYYANHLYEKTSLVLPGKPRKALLICKATLRQSLQERGVDLDAPIYMLLEEELYYIALAQTQSGEKCAVRIGAQDVIATVYVDT